MDTGTGPGSQKSPRFSIQISQHVCFLHWLPVATLPSLSPGYGSIANKRQASVCYGKIPSSPRAAHTINPHSPAAGHTCSLPGLGSHSASSYLLCPSWGQHPLIFFFTIFIFLMSKASAWKPEMKCAKMRSNLGQ